MKKILLIFAFLTATIAQAQTVIKIGAPSPTQIVDSINARTGENRIDASAIKNLPTTGIPNDGSVTAIKIATDAVSTIKIQNSAVSGIKILNGTITEDKLDGSVQTKLNATGGGATTLNNTVTSTATDEAATANVAKVLQDQINGLSSGSTNPNIVIANTLADITNAGANAVLEIRGNITLTANYTPPVNQVWGYITGSVNVGTFTLSNNGVKHFFNNKQLGLNLSLGSITGDVVLLNDKLYLSNIGGLDNNSFDNWKAVYNGLHIVNQNSSTLYFNKQTAIDTYYMQVYDDTYLSPFFSEQNDNLNTLTVGNGYDNVTITGDGKTKIKTYADNLDGSAVFFFHNTENSKIHGLHFIGDRYEHFYDEVIRVTAGATSAGNVRLVIREYADFSNSTVENLINELIPLTTGNLEQTRQQVIDYINTNAAFPNHTASAVVGSTTDIQLRTAAGQYTDAIFTNVSSGATVSYRLKFYEWGHCIVQGSRAVNSQITNNIIQDYHGDGIAKGEHGNGTPNIDFADLTQGFINDAGVVSASTDYYYLTGTRNMPSPHQWFMFTTNTATSVKLLHFRYWMLYYDENDNFIEKSPTLTPFDTYNYPTEFKKYRILVDNSGSEMSEFNYFVNSTSYPEGGLIAWNTFKDNRRHGITNVLINQVVEHNTFDRNSGISPEIDLNIEDWQKRVGGQIVRYNIFNTTNVANISLKGPNGVQIYGNRFKQGSYSINNALGSDVKKLAITVSYARNAKIYNNEFLNKTTYVDIMTTSYNNFYTNSVLALRNGSPKVYNETFVNSRIGDGRIGSVAGEGLGGGSGAILENSVFYINEDWGNNSFILERNTITHKNNRYYFNHKASNHFALTDESLREVQFNSTSNNFMTSLEATINNGEHEGSYDGTYVYGAKVASNMLHRVGWSQYAAPNKNFDISTSLNIQNGYEKDFTIENGKVKGWFWLELGEYPTTGGGNYKTIKVKNVEINVPARVDATEGHLNNSKFGSGITLQNLVRVTKDANVNLVFENVKFISEDETTGLFMYFGNRGTVDLVDCTFDAPNAENVNFNSTGDERTSGVYAGPNTGVITITRPITPGNRITFTGATIITAGSGEANTATNLGTGEGLATTKSGLSLPFKSLVAGTGVTITSDANEVTINSTATGGGATNLTYTASPTNGIVASDTGTDATIPLADGTNAGLISPSEKTSISTISGKQDAITLTTTGTSGAATLSAGTLNIPQYAGGVNLASNLLLTNGTGSSPQNGVTSTVGGNPNSFYKTILNGTGYLTVNNNGTLTQTLFSSSGIRPSITGVQDFGNSANGYRDGWFTRNIYALAFRTSGGTVDQLVTGTGTLVANNFLSAPTVQRTSASIPQVISHSNSTVLFTIGTDLTYTIQPNSTVAAPIGTRIFIKNRSATSVTVVAGAGVTYNGNMVLAAGESGFIVQGLIDEWD